jgi:hypothetical protein
VYCVIWQPWPVISRWDTFLYNMQLTHRLALGSFRGEAVSCLRVTCSLHGDLIGATCGFVYNISRASYKKKWCSKFRGNLFQTRKRFANTLEGFGEEVKFQMGTDRVEDIRLIRENFADLVPTQPIVFCFFYVATE